MSSYLLPVQFYELVDWIKVLAVNLILRFSLPFFFGKNIISCTNLFLRGKM